MVLKKEKILRPRQIKGWLLGRWLDTGLIKKINVEATHIAWFPISRVELEIRNTYTGIAAQSNTKVQGKSSKGEVQWLDDWVEAKAA